MGQKKVWKIADTDEALRRQIAKALHISDALAGVLANRGFTDLVEAEKFFYPQRQRFTDPFLMKGMEAASQRIITAIETQELMVIYGDYDVDGITSVSLMVKVLCDLGANVDFYIPERQAEGYGLHVEAMETLLTRGVSLLITVDCGISAVEETAALRGRMDIIITDHHLAPEVLPDVLAILNPKQTDCAYPEKALAGVGVAYKLCQALWRKLRNAELTAYLEIAALGTIADIVPLRGENRIIVKRGLVALNESENLGIRALVEVCGLTDKKVGAGHVGFMIAPRLNAAGRLSSAITAVELLITEDATRAKMLAEELNLGNQERQCIEKEILEKAEASLQSIDKQAARVLVVVGEGWNSGVIGIVASRLVDKYYRPTIVINEQDGMGKGSCRSIPGFHMYEALQKCADLLEGFGGHAQAAGLTIQPENIAALRQRLEAIAGEALTEEAYIPVLKIDATLQIEDVTEAFVEELECLEPYGMGNPRPLFACMGARVLEAKSMGQFGAHLRFKVKQKEQCGGGIAWNMGSEAEALQTKEAIDLAFQPEINEWKNSRSVQLKAQDFRSHEKVLTEIDQLFLAATQADAYRDIGAAQQFFTKAVGVSFEGRQQCIAGLKAGDAIALKRQPDNPHDENAIALTAPDGADIGFLRAQIAAKLAPLIDRGVSYEAQIADITGSAESNFGVNLCVWQVQKPLFSQMRCETVTLEETCRQLLGDRAYHKGQADALAALSRGENTLVVMGTGRGKSAIFQTHAVMTAINARKMTIVLYPLRALVNDQYLSLRERLAPMGIGVYKGNGTLSSSERGALFEALRGNAVDILLTTPEFLEANMETLHLEGQNVGFFVVDECHHIADGGRRPAYKHLARLLKRLGNPLALGVTATADSATASDVRAALQVKTQIIDKTIRENLAIKDARNESDKFAYIRALLKGGEKLLIFVNSRKKAVEVAGDLRDACPELAEQIGFYHAGLSNEWRVKVETWFKSGALQVVVATSAFGEGVDLPDIRHVILYHLPFDMTSFNQQCGRVGRDGVKSFIHLLFGKEDVKLNCLILKERAPERETIGKIYLILKNQCGAEGSLSLTNQEIAQCMDRQHHQYIGESGVGSCLKILEELRLISRETFGGARSIYLHPAPAVKLDLMQSASFVEGVNEREEFEQFSANVLQLKQEELLLCVNKPIYPADEWYNDTNEQVLAMGLNGNGQQK